MAYWTLIYPVDTIKSIVQSQDRKAHHQPISAWRLAADLYR